MRRMSLICASAVLLCALPAAAQNSGDATKPGDPCQAQPDNSKSASGKAGTEQKSSNGTLSGTLNPCGGVLKPPPTGDRGMTTPAPNAGNTPVIKPGEIKPQQSDPNQQSDPD